MMLLYLSSTFKSTSIYAQCPLAFWNITNVPELVVTFSVMFLRGTSRGDFLLQLNGCFLFILERCLNKGLDALVLTLRCLPWQRSSVEGTKLRS